MTTPSTPSPAPTPPSASPIVAERKKHCILVVDDDRLARRLLEVTLTKNDYHVITTDCVDAAIQAIQQNGIATFDAVVTDYRMPGRDGLDLLSWIHEHDGTLATIMVTAEGEKNLVTDSLRGGAIDFLDKPIQTAQFLAAVSRAIGCTRQQRQLKAAEASVRELAGVQHTLVQMHAQATQERVEVCFYPRQEAGGDFAAVFPIGPQNFVVLATDVSGHDLRAAFIASYFQGLVRGMMEKKSTIEEVFGYFNRFLLDDWNRPGNWPGHNHTETSIAACAIAIDLENKTLSSLDCGFPAPLRLNTKGLAEWMIESGSSPLGWFPATNLTPHTQPVEERSVITLWSDGVEDHAADLQIDPLALAFRLRTTHRKGDQMPTYLAGARDDIMAITINAGSETTALDLLPQALVFQRYAGSSEHQVDKLQEFWRRSILFALPHFEEARLFDILICIREAVINALKHGCLGSPDCFATLQVTWFPTEKMLRIRVDDPGSGHDFNSIKHQTLTEEELVTEHRGLILMQNMADTFQSERRGSILTLEFFLN